MLNQKPRTACFPAVWILFIAGFPAVLFILLSLCIQRKNTFATLEVWGGCGSKYGKLGEGFIVLFPRGLEESEPGSGQRHQVEGYLFEGKVS